MRLSGRTALSLVLSLALAASFGVWMTSAPSADAAVAAAALPGPGTFKCPPVKKTAGNPKHTLQLAQLGAPFESVGIGGPSIEGTAGPSYRNSAGQKTVPITITNVSVASAVEGLGAVNYWLDTSRPGKSAIWEKTPGTEFPAVQVMSFNVFVTFEALPGQTFRTATPATLRSDDVRDFPPPSGTLYRMVSSVNLEDADHPGEVVGRILTGSFEMP